ncbi:MAG: hypothetical protein IH851_01850 [Armatimonadetes bacterium]|nr:hypothetical protein [Armatimonadota bacterium]
MVLSPDREKTLQSYPSEPGRFSLSGLKTGRAVVIGDTPATLRRKLGSNPTINKHTGGQNSERVYTYRYMWGTRDSGKEYVATYIFRHERLWSIRFAQNLWPG